MAKDDGYSSYDCDRDPAHDNDQAYLKDTAPQASEWHKIQRLRADGTPIERWLCAACYKEYRALAERQDAEFNAFMASATPKEA